MPTQPTPARPGSTGGDGAASTSRSQGDGLSRLVSRRSALRAGLWGTVGLAAGGAGWAAWSARLETTRHDVPLGLGPTAHLRVACIADLHLRGRREDYRPLVDALQRAEPDLLVVVGDTVDHRNGDATFDLISVLGAVRAPAGKLATLGNWEHLSLDSFDDLAARYERVGTRLLVDESVDVGPLRVVGVDDWLSGSPDPRAAVAAAAERPTLILSHCPQLREELVLAARDLDHAPCLCLSGHTHGGQVAPLGQPLWTPPGSGRYVSGWYPDEHVPLYVTRGVGFSGVPVRIGAHPELTLLDIA